MRNIEIIGEASNNVQQVAPEFARLHDEIPWQVMYTMRNRVSHAYDKVDLAIVWKTIQNDLPGLYRQIQTVQATFIERDQTD
ncbi:HepT-like ribonuclease domain-containing protein [Pseudothauera nasutitermitis]|uniref:HepT-like ribonuclease domain-containing protein n=1 Tax=Pseudothauera nasutitermitis TaxID=2565930 RepID=UPI001B3B23F4